MIEIALLGAPRGKERPRLAKSGHVYTPEKTRDYEAALKYAAREAMGERPPLAGPLSIELNIVVPITLSWPKKRQVAARDGTEWPVKKPDLDNMMKVIDACNLIVWVDDSQIVKAELVKKYGDKPGLWLRVTPIDEPATEEGIFG